MHERISCERARRARRQAPRRTTLRRPTLCNYALFRPHAPLCSISAPLWRISVRFPSDLCAIGVVCCAAIPRLNAPPRSATVAGFVCADPRGKTKNPAALGFVWHLLRDRFALSGRSSGDRLTQIPRQELYPIRGHGATLMCLCRWRHAMRLPADDTDAKMTPLPVDRPRLCGPSARAFSS